MYKLSFLTVWLLIHASEKVLALSNFDMGNHGKQYI